MRPARLQALVFSRDTLFFQQRGEGHDQFAEFHRRGNANGFLLSTKPEFSLPDNHRAACLRQEGVHLRVARAERLRRRDFELDSKVTKSGSLVHTFSREKTAALAVL